jgi:hypothetical protein
MLFLHASTDELQIFQHLGAVLSYSQIRMPLFHIDKQ